MLNISLQQKNAEEKMDAILEWPMVLLTIVLIPIMAAPFLFSLSPLLKQILSYADITIWAIFYLELFLKLLVSSNRLKTLKNNWLLVIILLIPVLRIFRFVRLARILRLTRLLRIQYFIQHLHKNTQLLIHNLEYGLLTFLVLILLFGFVIWQVEQGSTGGIQSLGDALWWSVITITTIGYGDIVPVTETGRIVGAIVAFAGVITFMVITARIAAIFTRNRIESSQDKILQRVTMLLERLEKNARS